jgi:transcriptional regulator with XRE-family HTH domain
VIDPARLRHLRLDRGLTQRKLAAACGVDPLTVHRLEDGADAGDLPLRIVHQLANALGTDINYLLPEQDTPADGGDVARRLGAALFSQHRATATDLATAHDITLDELHDGLAALTASAGSVGMTVLHNDGQVWLAPQAIGGPPAAPPRPLTTAEARLLRRIHRGIEVRRNLTQHQRRTLLPALLRLGLIEVTDAGLRLSAPAASALAP